MTSETKEWDDEEETIINFTPKPRPSQPRVPEQAPTPPSNDLLGLGVHPSPAYKQIPEEERSSSGVVYEESENSVLQEALQPVSEMSSPPTLPRIPPLESRAVPPPVMPRSEESVEPSPEFTPFEPRVTPSPEFTPSEARETPAPPVLPPMESPRNTNLSPPVLPPMTPPVGPPVIRQPESNEASSAPTPRAAPILPPLPPPLPPLPTNLTPRKSAPEVPATQIELPQVPARQTPLWQNPPEQTPLPENALPVKSPVMPDLQFGASNLAAPVSEAAPNPVQPSLPQTPAPRIMLKQNPVPQTPPLSDSLPGFSPAPGNTPAPLTPPIPDLPALPEQEKEMPEPVRETFEPVWEEPKNEAPPSWDDIDPPTVIDVPALIQRDLKMPREEPISPSNPGPESAAPVVSPPAWPPAAEPVSPAADIAAQKPISPPPADIAAEKPIFPPPVEAAPENRAPRQSELKPEPSLPPPQQINAQKRDESEEDPEKTNIYIPQRTSDEVGEVAWVVLMKTPSVRLYQLFRLDSARMEIGRSYDTPIFLDDRTVSMRHAAIRYERVGDKNEFVLYDLASTNGTYLNDNSVHMAVLKDDDRIRVGETEMAFKKVGDPTSDNKPSV